MTAAFGDLARPARAHLQAAAAAMESQTGDAVIPAAWAVGRISRTLARYLADIASHEMVDAVTDPGLDSRSRAAVDAREALRMAALTLQRVIRDAGDSRSGAAHPAAQQLRAAGAGLAAGRDVLRTHFRPGQGRVQVAGSDWAAVITSVPVTRALGAEVSSWAEQLALLAARLSLAAAEDAAVAVPVQRALAGACHWLLTASGALAASQRDDPVRSSGTFLLEAIRTALPPPRLPPAAGESLAQLAEGVAVSAARLRAISWTTAGQATWSPAMTAESWRWKATATAVMCHISERTLKALADSPAIGSAGPDGAARLRTAAEMTGRAWERWRDVAAAWNDIATDTQGLTGPGLPDAGDLMVRVGRIAFTDPAWAPGRDHRGQLRGADDLAPDADRFRIVLAAVHRAVDALAISGAADERAAGNAVRASRLYVPVRTLPERYDLPYRFGRPVPTAAAAVLDSYQAANETTARAATAADALAVTANTPTGLLAMARAAVAEKEHPADEHRPREPATIEEAPRSQRTRSAAPRLPGPVEQALRRLPSADPVLILRARAIDRAGRALIRDATASPTSKLARTGQPRAAPNAAGLARRDFPRQSAAALSAAPNTPPRSRQSASRRQGSRQAGSAPSC